MDIFGKGRRWRTVPLAPLLGDVLRLWLEGQDWPGPAGPLVPSARDEGEHVGAGWISRQLCAALHDNGIAQTTHGMRHSFARLLLADCNDVRAVSELLGHASIATTEKYYTSGVKAATERAVGFLPDPRG
jgi:integrase/recombinase XerC